MQLAFIIKFFFFFFFFFATLIVQTWKNIRLQKCSWFVDFYKVISYCLTVVVYLLPSYQGYSVCSGGPLEALL